MSEVLRQIESVQHRASDPKVSAWVNADAGTGKTHVLTQRVVRLLLGGAPPAKILCLTYTKAAAANMSARIFDMLAKWTAMDDAALTKAIADTGAPPADARTLSAARKLFARTVETPGGLKILTLHSFCERLLHLFPFEANVAAGFSTIEDLRAAELTHTARRLAFTEAARGPGSALGLAAQRLSMEISASETLDKILKEALGQRALLLDSVREYGTIADYCAALAKQLGLRAGETSAEVTRAILEDGIPGEVLPGIAARLDKGLPTTVALARSLRAIAAAPASSTRLDDYLELFFTDKGNGTPRGTEKRPLINSALVRSDPQLFELMITEQNRLLILRDKLRAAQCVERTQALLTIADCVIGHYARLKGEHGLLDYEDLILRTAALLTRSDAAWVLYKLDAGIDHILIDEAQDTSPGQWQILTSILASFWSGAGARPASRTFFAVGDEKQSIFSFQGAIAAQFEDQRTALRKAIEVQQKFVDAKLNISFRSAQAIVETIDKVFSVPENFQGLSGDARQVRTELATIRSAVPGHVELWPVVAKEKEDDPKDWKLPLDSVRPDSPAALVAGRIAQTIVDLCAPAGAARVYDRRAGGPRPINPGDVIILVRSRGAFFETMIRALKDAGVPVAGADQLMLTQHIAVMDLIAAGRASLLPEDDLTLACLLKSPLIGLDDDNLITLAPLRKGSLWQALQDHAADNAAYAGAVARLKIWQRRAASVTPFQFYAQLLGEDGGRRQFGGRLGPEAGDAIDEFLAQALDHQRDHPPSLVTFLDALQAADLKIKRDMDAGHGAVRVMTAHGAKGLEAPVIFLPDTCGAPFRKHSPKLLTLANPSRHGAPDFLAWSQNKKNDSDILAAARARLMAAAGDEHRRLLYVALTRAQDRLYVAGFAGMQKVPDDCWHKMIENTLGPALTPHPAFWDDSQKILRRAEVWPSSASAPALAATYAAPLPDFLREAAAQETSPGPPLRPSNPLAAADAPGPDALSSALRAGAASGLVIGRLMHRLLQYLPDVPGAERHAIARRFLRARGAALSEAQHEMMARQALGVLDDPALGGLFGEGSRAEVALAGEVARAGRAPLAISGQIDRLAIMPDEALIADFKTGAPRGAGDIPPAYVAQLALYQSVIGTIYPGRRVRCFIVWTAGPSVMELGSEELAAALADVCALLP